MNNIKEPSRWYHENGNVKYEQYYYHNIKNYLHREDGPASIEYYESGALLKKIYIIEDLWHREDGPAYISYYENGKVQEYNWFIENKLHRTDGPASTLYHENGSLNIEEYYMNDKWFKSLEHYNNYIKTLILI